MVQTLGAGHYVHIFLWLYYLACGIVAEIFLKPLTIKKGDQIMKKKNVGFKMLIGGLFLFVLMLGSAAYAQVTETVNLILKNVSSSGVEVALIDQYGGNFTVTIDAGTSQNQTLKVKSEIKVAGNVVHVAMPEDEGKEIIIAGQ